jgi:Ca-activated chloride channel family protein
MATVGEKVSLGLEPTDKVKVVEVLNDFERAETGRIMLPNLVVGMQIPVVIRLSIAARPDGSGLLNIRLAWDDPQTRVRRVTQTQLGNLGTLPLKAWSKLPDDPAVSEQEALLMMARAQREAGFAQQRGDLARTQEFLEVARACASTVMGSQSIESELKAIDTIEAALKAGDHAHSWKLSKLRSYMRRTGQSSIPPTLGETET